MLTETVNEVQILEKSVRSPLTTEWTGALLIMGDFNVELLGHRSAMVVQYKNVQQPTRVAMKSSTLIDHVISNVPVRVTYTSVLPCSTISDHDAPYVYMN